MRKFVKLVVVLGLTVVMTTSTSCKKANEEKQPPAAPAATEPGLPVLFSFETDDAVAAWKVEEVEDVAKACKVSASTENATDGKRSLKMVLTEHKWPGAYTTTFPTTDWSGYKKLKFDVTTDQPRNLHIRIDDTDSTDYASRYNSGGEDLDKGKTTVEVYLDDVADDISLKKIARLVLFGSGVPAGETWTYYIDNIRLEK